MAKEVLSEIEGQIGIVRINRAAALNALNQQMIGQVTAALQRFDDEPSVTCTLVAGNERAFATGVEVAEMLRASAADLLRDGTRARWDDLDRLRKPLVAAVSGYALGAGCELALACDIVVAAETARFGLPEIHLGIVPGGGGTQRLTRAVGKAWAMDLILTGRMITAREALRAGLVSRVVPRENCYEEALNVGRGLCSQPPLAIRAAKEAVRKAHELSLREGLEYEHALYTMLFATDDQKEGMRAFLEKRPPIFAGR